jgi:YVTN family beta-propeller protein
VDVINVATGHIVNSVTVTLDGLHPTSLALSPDGSQLYVARAADLGGPAPGELVIHDAVTLQTTGIVAVGRAPADIALSPDGTRAFVVNTGSNDVTVVALATGLVVATVTVGVSPTSAVVTPDGSAVYVTNAVGDSVSRISTATNTVTTTTTVGAQPTGIDVTPDGSRVVVATAGRAPSGGSVTVIDTLTNAVTATYPLATPDIPPVSFGRPATPPAHIAAVSNTRAYASFSGDPDGGVWLIDLTTGSIITVTSVPWPVSLALDGSRSRLFVVASVGIDQSAIDAIDTASTGYTTIARGLWVDVAITPSSVTCLFEASPTPAFVTGAGGSGQWTIPAPVGCAWGLTTADSGITLDTPAGTGPGTAAYTIGAATEPRRFTIAAGRQRLIVDQTIPVMNVDLPNGQTYSQPFAVSLWAIDRSAIVPPSLFGSPGVDLVDTWAYPASGAAPIYVGTTRPSLSRPDVVAMFGQNYSLSGFVVPIANLPAGTYSLVFVAHSTRSNTFNNAAARVVTVRAAAPILVVDTPRADSTVRLPFDIGGWAVDPLAAKDGTPGIDVIHVWAYPSSGAAPMFVGQTTTGRFRPDVGDYLGSPFSTSGFLLTITTLPPGRYTLSVYGRSTATSTFSVVKTVAITVAASAPRMVVDLPVSNATVTAPFQMFGWALDLSASSGTGVDAVHVWAYPVAGGAPIFAGAATFMDRPDVGAAFGSQYTPAGFQVSVTALPAGAYDLVVFARSVVAGAFNNTKIVRVTVQ